MPTFLISGATGQQGGATMDALLAAKRSDLTIKALTRNTSSPKAQALANRGIKMTKGDLHDRASLLAALEGVDVAYLVTDFTGPRGIEGELEQGRFFVECCEETGVKHLVFSSLAGADAGPDVPHFDSKGVIETYIKQSKIPSWTMIRPTSFMENTPPPGVGRFMLLGIMASVFGKNGVYHIACEDIGKTIAAAMLDPESFKGRAVTLVGEIAGVDSMQRSLERGEGLAEGSTWRARVPRWLIMAVLPTNFKGMFKWLSKSYADGTMPGEVQTLRDIIGEPTTIEMWARKDKARREANKT